MSTVTPMFSFTAPGSEAEMAYDFTVLASYLEGRAYDDTTAQECASWLHCADLAHQLARALKRLGHQTEERSHSP